MGGGLVDAEREDRRASQLWRHRRRVAGRTESNALGHAELQVIAARHQLREVVLAQRCGARELAAEREVVSAAHRFVLTGEEQFHAYPRNNRFACIPSAVNVCVVEGMT